MLANRSLKLLASCFIGLCLLFMGMGDSQAAIHTDWDMFRQFRQAHKPFVMVYTRDNCGYCHKQMKEIEKIAGDFDFLIVTAGDRIPVPKMAIYGRSGYLETITGYTPAAILKQRLKYRIGR